MRDRCQAQALSKPTVIGMWRTLATARRCCSPGMAAREQTQWRARATAEGTLEQGAARSAATAAIGRRYAGEDGVEGFAQYADARLRLLVRVRPTRITARDRVGEN
jgi:hypothetical protein